MGRTAGCRGRKEREGQEMLLTGSPTTGMHTHRSESLAQDSRDGGEWRSGERALDHFGEAAVT